MTNLRILEASNKQLADTKKYVNNRRDGLDSETYIHNAVNGLAN